MEHFLKMKRILDRYEEAARNESLDQVSVEIASNERALDQLRFLLPKGKLDTWKQHITDCLFVCVDHIETYDELLAWLLNYAEQEEEQAQGRRGEWKEKAIHFWYATIARKLALELVLGKMEQ